MRNFTSVEFSCLTSWPSRVYLCQLERSTWEEEHSEANGCVTYDSYCLRKPRNLGFLRENFQYEDTYICTSCCRKYTSFCSLYSQVFVGSVRTYFTFSDLVSQNVIVHYSVLRYVPLSLKTSLCVFIYTTLHAFSFETLVGLIIYVMVRSNRIRNFYF